MAERKKVLEASSEATKASETPASIEGPTIGPKDAQRLYNATIKTINQLINEPASDTRDARLQQMRNFRDKLKEAFPDNIKEPNARTLRNVQVHPNDIRGNVDLYRFPNEGKKTVEVPVEPTEEKGATTKVSEGEKPKQAAPTEKTTQPTTTSTQPRTETSPTPSRGPLQGTRTLARPGTANIQDVGLKASEIQDYRRQLQAEQVRLTDLMQKGSPAEKVKAKEKLEKVDRAYYNASALEKQFYDQGKAKTPDDWGTGQPKQMTMEQVKAQPKLNYEKLPEAILEPVVGTDRFAREPGPKREERYKGQKFANKEIRRLVNDIGDWRKELLKLDEKSAKDRPAIEKLNEKINNSKDKLRYFSELREVESQKEGGSPETNLLTSEYNELAQKMKSLLTPEQQEAVRKGETIDINRIPKKREFLQALRELGRERDRISQGMNDEIQYVNAAPGNTINKWREMDPEDRAYEVNEIKKAQFMQKMESDIPGYFNEKTGKSEEEFYKLPPQAQDAWKKRYSSDLIRAGSPGINGADVYKWMFGGGTEFYSKYPPELQRPMIRSAEKGFKGMDQSTQMLKDQLQQDPFSRILGPRAGSALNQLMFGAPGNYFTAPPEPYEYPLNQPQQGYGPQGPTGGPNGGQQPSLNQVLDPDI